MSDNQFTLKRDAWYGWSMYPGHAGTAYHSPIKVEAVSPLGNGLIELEFLNAGYASGLQQMKTKFRVYRRGANHLVLDDLQRPERTIIIEPLTSEWVIGRSPWFVGRMSELSAGVERSLKEDATPR